MDHPVPCTISIGSNAPEREKYVERAIEHLRNHLTKCSVSSIYETDAINGKDAPYLNAVLYGQTSLNVASLVKFLKDWETEEGRSRDMVAGDGCVLIDLDLVIFNSRILRPKDFERHYFNIGYRELLADGAFQYE